MKNVTTETYRKTKPYIIWKNKIIEVQYIEIDICFQKRTHRNNEQILFSLKTMTYTIIRDFFYYLKNKDLFSIVVHKCKSLKYNNVLYEYIHKYLNKLLIIVQTKVH